MLVRDVMKTEIYTISPEATLNDAVKIIYNNVVSGLVVVDPNKKVLGLLSEKDIYKSLYPGYSDFMKHPEAFTNFENQEKAIHEMGDTPVQDMMTKDVITIKEDDHLMKVGAKMLAREIHRLPVVDDDGLLIGVLTRGMIYRALFRRELGL
jgi:CBS domain-containing protein